MDVAELRLQGVRLLRPRVFEDARGFFFESFRASRFEAVGLPTQFVQDNHSCSERGILRGLHYQLPHTQGKLVWVIKGEIWDVVVDLRMKSETLGQWVAVALSEENRQQIFVPEGFAHGFCVLSPRAEVVYKCTDDYHPESEHTILWNDPQLGIEWPIEEPLLSEKDRQGVPFAEAPKFP